jgi:hypothetical protein
MLKIGPFLWKPVRPNFIKPSVYQKKQNLCIVAKSGFCLIFQRFFVKSVTEDKSERLVVVVLCIQEGNRFNKSLYVFRREIVSTKASKPKRHLCDTLLAFLQRDTRGSK